MAALVAVAESIGATVYHQPMADGVNFPGSHPLFAGMLAPVNAAIRQALSGHDVVLVAGTHAFMPHHYTAGSAIPDGVTVVQADSNPAEIGRNFAVAAGLVGGLRPTLERLAATLAGRMPQAAERMTAIGEATRALRHATDEAALARYGDTTLEPLSAVHALVSGSARPSAPGLATRSVRSSPFLVMAARCSASKGCGARLVTRCRWRSLS
ncbi:MAG: hypothetical protein ACM3ML_05155 [Micromonosporaceae bacterium]